MYNNMVKISSARNFQYKIIKHILLSIKEPKESKYIEQPKKKQIAALNY